MQAVSKWRNWIAAGVVLFAAGVQASAQTRADVAQYAQWREQMAATFFLPKPLPALEPKSYGTFAPMPGVVAEKVTYGTEFGMRVPAVVYRPEHEGRRLPALVVVNGHGGDKYSWYAFYTGLLYARAGGVVLTYDPIGEGERSTERRTGTRDHDRIVDVQGYPQHLAGLMITDVMQAVSYLRSRADVDPERIAIAGYSMGSFVSALTGAYDTRIHAVVLSGGGDLDGPGGYWDSSTKYMCQAVPWQSLKVLGDRPAVIYALNQQRGPTLIINGTADSLVDIPHHLEPYFAELRTRVERLTGTKKNIFETYFIPDVSHRPNWVTRPGAEWLERTLGFPNWTRSEIEKMPETHISAWAKGNNVDMDKGYIQEDREGGVMALGSGFPNVTRAQLTVVPIDEWQRDRDRYVYESWVRQTLATIAPKLPLNLPHTRKEAH